MAEYVNGRRKGGSIRFKEGYIRVPTTLNNLPVFETREHDKDPYSPCGLVDIARLVICPAQELTQEELAMDGFEDHKRMLAGMQRYYFEMERDSIVSFYTFGRVDWLKKTEDK